MCHHKIYINSNYVFILDPTFNPHLTEQRSRNPIHGEIAPLICHFKKSMYVSSNQCAQKSSEKSSYTIHVINRTQRKILNLDDIVARLRKLGFTNTRSLTYEEYTVEDQIRLMACTDLLIGVQGAAMQWYWHFSFGFLDTKIYQLKDRKSNGLLRG